MTYMGRIQDGKVVLEGEQKLDEGTVLRIETVDGKIDDESLSKALLKLAGTTADGPADGSVNVDHYLYGLPKKQ